MYSLLMIQWLHKLYICLSGRVRYYTTTYSFWHGLVSGKPAIARKLFLIRAQARRRCSFLMVTFEGNGKLPETQTCSSKLETCDGRTVCLREESYEVYWEWIITRTGKSGPFVAMFIYQITRHEKTARLTKAHKRYSENFCDASDREVPGTWTVKALEILEEGVAAFKRKVVDTFDEYCNSGLYTLMYHLLHGTVEDLSKFRTLSVLRSTHMRILKWSLPMFIEILSKGDKRGRRKP